jgi:hypothetical protein
VSGNLQNLSNIAFISLGIDHSCALGTNGEPFCWGLNSNGQLGDGSRTDESVVVGPVPSFSFNIDPNVTIPPNGNKANLIAIANCPEGQTFEVEVDLTQGETSGDGWAKIDCTGGLGRFPVEIHSRGADRFQPGAAQAHAVATPLHRGDPGQQEWTRQVQVSLEP